MREETAKVEDARAPRDAEGLLAQIARAATVAPLLSEVVALAERAVPGARAALRWLDGGQQTLHHIAAGSLPASFIDAVEGHPTDAQRRTCGAAIATRRPAFSEDLRLDPRWDLERDAAEAFGLRACWSWPLLDTDGAAMGTLALYFDAPAAPKPEQEGAARSVVLVAEIAVQRLRSDRALAASEARYRTLFHAIDEGFCLVSAVVDAEGRAVDFRFDEANPAFEAQTGLVAPVGRTAREIGPALDAAWLDAFGAIATTRAPRRHVLEAASRDRVFDVYAFPFGDLDGAQVAVLSTDVTDQRRIRSELTAAEATRHATAGRLAFVLEHTSDAFYLLDARWRFEFVNDAAERLLHRQRGELLGRTLWNAFPDLRGTEHERAFQNAMAMRSPQAFEVYLSTLAAWHEVRAHPVDGTVAVFARDVTERKLADLELRASEERFRLVARAIADVVWDWDVVSGRQVRLGRRTGRVELPTPDLEAWAASIHEDDRPSIIASLGTAMEQGALEWEAAYRVRTRAGGIAHVEDACVLVRDAHGAAVRLVGCMVDVTEKVELRTRVDRAQRMEAVGQLTGGMAHDFNNLLTVVLGSAEALATRVHDDARAVALTGMIRGAAERGAGLTQRLLAYSRQLPLDPRPTDVARQVEALLPMLRQALGEDVDLRLGAHDAAVALVDPAGLDQVLLNLCLNARDAMPTGGALTFEVRTLEIGEDFARAREGLSAGRYVVLSVTDTGHGMAPEVLGRAFDPFFTTKPQGAGTGLGLSSVLGFVRQSGGHVQAYSEVGEGTTVRVYLPASDTAPTHRSAAMASQPEPQGTEHVLVVEDDANVRSYTVATLRELGYTVTEAEHGPEALACIDRDASIDLLLTDVVMPGGLSGRDTADRVRARVPGVRVLFVSGYSADAIVHQGRLDAGVRLLTKPFDRGQLARAVRNALDAVDAAP